MTELEKESAIIKDLQKECNYIQNSIGWEEVKSISDLSDALFKTSEYLVISKSLHVLNKYKEDYIFRKIDKLREDILYSEFKKYVDNFVTNILKLKNIELELDEGLHKLHRNFGIIKYYNRCNEATILNTEIYEALLKTIFINTYIEVDPVCYKHIRLSDKNKLALSTFLDEDLCDEFLNLKYKFLFNTSSRTIIENKEDTTKIADNLCRDYVLSKMPKSLKTQEGLSEDEKLIQFIRGLNCL